MALWHDEKKTNVEMVRARCKVEASKGRAFDFTAMIAYSVAMKVGA